MEQPQLQQAKTKAGERDRTHSVQNQKEEGNASKTIHATTIKSLKGLTNRQATEIIINGLKGLLKEREENFRDHIEKRKKKCQVALQRIFHPFTLFTLAYTGFLINNTVLLKKHEKSNQTDEIQFDQHELITQHIITIVVVLLLVLIDIYLRIQRLNFRVFNIDSKIQDVIDKFDPENKESPYRDEQYQANHQEAEFSYYQNCFTWTLRNREWKKIPSNTLAEGDIIKLLPDDTAPALIQTFDPSNSAAQTEQRQVQSEVVVSKISSPQFGASNLKQSMSKQQLYFNKGTKINIKQDNLLLQTSTKSINEPHEAFERGMKEFIIFIVKKTPCIQDLTEYISNMESRKEFSKNLLYFQNIQTAEKWITVFLGVSWVVCIVINIAYIYTDNIIDYFNHHTYLPLISFSFVAPQIFSICEAWANALMITLFNSLQFDDYNKYLIKRLDFKLLKRQLSKQERTKLNSGSNDDNGARMQTFLKRPLLKSELKKRKAKKQAYSWRELLLCECLKRKQQKQEKRHKGHNHHNKRNSRRSKQNKEDEFSGLDKTDKFYEIYDSQNRGLRRNWKKFWEYYRSGCTHINNIFAALSCVSIFAFVDKEGIITEMQKYVDEVAIIDKKEQKVVMNMVHNNHVGTEEEVYTFENPKLFKDNVPLLRALGLAFMCARNPKETDTDAQMVEVFSKNNQNPPNTHSHSGGGSGPILYSSCLTEGCRTGSGASGIKQDIGFHFHHALRQETEAHQDCVCALAKLIGHSDASFMNYDQLCSVWNIVHNPQMLKEVKEGKDKLKKSRKVNLAKMPGVGKMNNVAGGGAHDTNELETHIQNEQKEKQHRSFDDKQSSSDSDSLSYKSQHSDGGSIKSENVQNAANVLVFAAQKQKENMLLERMFQFGHIIQTIALDKSTNKYQSFSRGEANIIVSMCSDYWNGEKIMPIKKHIANHIRDILFQWQAQDFVAIAFSYKPVTPDLQKLIADKKIKNLDYSINHSKEVRETLETFQKNQIFLGIIGIKHHKKQEANKMFESLDEAGIRGVLFSKEGVLETKSLAKELGIDSEWNAWISLSENPSEFTKLYNMDGHLILPVGIQGIKKHIQDVDKIPLQVPMFCDSNAQTTRQMFEIYQENGDVVACIGNIMNSENIHIFQQANVAVGMRIEPSYRCYRCNGRISKLQIPPGPFKRDSHQNNEGCRLKQETYKPNKFDQLSAAINALACTFVFDANTNIYCFFSIFREARRLRESVEQACMMGIFIIMNVYFVLFIDLVLGINHYSDQLEILYIMCIFVPVISVSCMSRPTKNSVMKRHVLSPKYLQYLDYAIFMLKCNAIKVIITTALLYAVRCLYLSEAIEKFSIAHPGDYKTAFEDPLIERAFGNQIRYLLFGKWYKLKATYKYWEETQQLEHKFNFCFLLLILTFWSIGLESSKSTLFFKFSSNTIFRVVVVLQLCFIIAYYGLSTTVFQEDSGAGLYYPSYRVWLCAFAALVVLGIFEELTKKHIRRLFERDHNRLSIFFSTKLGMWSPR